MNRNLFLKELGRNAFSFILWMLAITLLVTLTMSVYPTFMENQSKVLGMMSLVPKSALQFKGISNFSDMLSILGFYAINNIIYMMVLGSIFAIVISSNILLKEEYHKTAEYLLTRPLNRSEVFLSKLSVVFIYVISLNLVTALAGFVSMQIVETEPFSFRAFLIVSFYTLLLNILFGSIGLFMSVLVKKPKPITTFSIGMVLVFYFMYTLSKITESASGIGYLSPFKYVNVDVVSPDYRVGFWNVLYFAGISVLLIVISGWLYKRKDIFV
jgi:ABC-2 type transport system permease protein